MEWQGDHPDTLQNVIGHWFIQGGESQFGELGECHSADELVAAILRAVRVKCPVVIENQRPSRKATAADEGGR